MCLVVDEGKKVESCDYEKKKWGDYDYYYYDGGGNDICCGGVSVVNEGWIEGMNWDWLWYHHLQIQLRVISHQVLQPCVPAPSYSSVLPVLFF